MTRKIQLLFVLFVFVSSTSCGLFSSRVPVQSDDPRVKELAETIINKKITADSQKCQDLMSENIGQQPKKGKKIRDAVKAYYQENYKDLDKSEKFNLKNKISAISEAIKTAEEAEIPENILPLEDKDSDKQPGTEITDEDLGVSFHLPRKNIRISKDEIQFDLKILQNIRNEYAIVLKNFTLIDESNNRQKFELIDSPEILYILAVKNKTISKTLKFKIPEDETPEKRLSFSFNFKNYIYLFSFQLNEDYTFDELSMIF